jgi:Ca2+-binding RTX toxin-like protein
LGNDLLDGGTGNDLLDGNEGDDNIIGGAGDDQIAGFSGNDTLTGSEGKDIFSFGGFSFGSQSGFSDFINIGIDTITDFTAGQDKIALSLSVFDVIPLALESPLDANTFAVVSSDNAVATNAAQIVYSQSTGTLFYNTNGVDAGLGNGAAFAKFTGNLTLTATDFTISS